MNRTRVFWLSFLAVALCAFYAAPARTQTTATGTITGIVTDNTNAVVAGTSVTLIDKATGDTRTTVSNGDGRYVFVNVDPGAYDMRFTKSGFAETRLAKITVEVATQLTENVQMKVGALSTTVTVTESAGAELQTMNSTIGTTIEHEELLNLPNTGRDSSTFATLQPGVNINGNTAGAVVDQNTFQLDGGNVTDDMSGDSNVYQPSFASDTSGVGVMHSPGQSAAPSAMIPTPVESIEEFKVGVSNQTADFNGGAGSQVQMATRRGTSAFHGAAYEYYLDNNFGGANTWDNNNVGFPQPSSHYSNFGANAGGPVHPGEILGGRTFIFGDYEGFRFPQSETFENAYPSPLLRSGMMAINGQILNLNPTATPIPTGMPASFYSTYGVTAGQAIAPTPCPGSPNGLCDPRGLGLNPVICSGGAASNGACSAGLWSLIPLPNDYTQGDGVNTGGYKGALRLPITSNFGVARLDHDFSSKWHLNGTYHYYHRIRAVSDQVDVGGFFHGDTFGQYASVANRPQDSWFYTTGMTTNISSTTTNEFHYSGTRNWWAYEAVSGVPNVAGYPAALEVGGENFNTFQPYNTNNQNTRWRYWNGHDDMFRDDLTKIAGQHLLTLGGIYQRNHDTHLRIDNGGFINIYEQYLIGQGTGVNLPNVSMTNYTPAAVTSGYVDTYGDYYANILGMVTSTQRLYTRSTGTKATGLPLNPLTSCAISGIAATADCTYSPPAKNSSIIPFYNAYFNDAWQMRPSFTLSYGLSYTVEMPPYSAAGTQDIPVDENGNELNTGNFLAAREGAALQGIPYDPSVGFAIIQNVNGHPKYPYNPFYAGLSPRLSLAWNPHFDADSFMGQIFGSGSTVIRGGWARIYGRLNGVDQVLVPILAPGLMQTVQCYGPVKGTASTCGGDPTDVFRVGVDCPTGGPCNAPLAPVSANLPQPWYPGVNDTATGSGEGLDPSFRPDRSDEFNLSVQRSITPKIMVEVGYIGRIIRNEFQPIDLNNVPYMMSQGGQQFQSAWANVTEESNFGANPNNVTAQPFFTAAISPTSPYCAGFTNCTVAFANNEAFNVATANVWQAWSDVSGPGYFNFGRSMLSDPIPATCQPTATPPITIGCNGQATDVFLNRSDGWGNYNAGFFQISFSDWHGLSLKSNLTFSRSLGTQAFVQASSALTVDNPYDLATSYGVQPFDESWAYNVYFTYTPPYYRDEHGALGMLLGGWSFTPLFVAGSGFPVEVQTGNGNGSSWGEGDANNESGATENAILIGPLDYTNTRKQGVSGTVDGGPLFGSGQNVFTNPGAAWDAFRNPILGIDTKDGGAGPVRGLPFWNMDLGLKKDLKFTERFDLQFYGNFTNVFNHMQAADPFLALYYPPLFGVLGGGGNVQANTPRQVQLGIRFGW
ncbi:MAG TPA: carboxypeptidase-like regulatory domain-containing protein [Candidatus Cybelea sp.]|nr:carboxypeptidase-like regulatory domain-containing protein [Candidatus Cybelea sp.]